MLYSTTHKQLSEFVKRNASKLRDCGDFFCYQRQPPDFDAPPAPQRDGTPQAGQPRWQPQPNVKLPEILKHERQNSTTFKDEAATDHIRKLEVRVAELERRLLAMEQGGTAPMPLTPAPTPQRGDTGPQGSEGPVGPPGPKPTPSEVLAIVERVGTTNRETLRGPSGPPGLVVVEVRKPNGTKDEFKATSGGRVIVDVDVAEVVKPRTKGK